jgi:pimeloyl-ACP methyl ester carboxylesterase
VAKTGKLIVKPLPGRIQKKLRSKMYTTIGSDMLVAEHLQETFKKVVTDDVRVDAANITIPTLLIYGDKDEATPLRFAEQFKAKLTNAKLVTVDGAGHFVHLDAAPRVTQEIKDFLV